ncbi:uncharacterized protein IWZ02DRAFT_94235 [Phyllosticta citriasiana]|uniref:uncharacterized protein n=1 Tax=Phyllosticta citriasiana TaxID=595635 RepID=UPI0030FDEA72
MARHGSAADWASPMPLLSASGATCPPICLGAVRLTLTDDGRYLSPLSCSTRSFVHWHCIMTLTQDSQPFDEISGVAKFDGQAAVRIRPVHYSRLLSVDLTSPLYRSVLPCAAAFVHGPRNCTPFSANQQDNQPHVAIVIIFISSLVRTDTPADNRPGVYRSSGQSKVRTRMSVLHTLGCLSSKSSGLVLAPARLHRSRHTDATVIRPSFFPDCLVGWLALSPN